MPRPPESRAEDNPWPQWPNIFRTSSAHEEGGERVYSVSTERFRRTTGGRVRALEALRGRDACATTGGSRSRRARISRFELEADLVLLAMGFVGPSATAWCPSSACG